MQHRPLMGWTESKHTTGWTESKHFPSFPSRPSFPECLSPGETPGVYTARPSTKVRVSRRAER